MNKLALFFDAPWTEALGWTILHSLWIGALVTLLWRLSLIGQRSPDWRYRSSLLSLVGLLSLVLLVFGYELSQAYAFSSLPVQAHDLTFPEQGEKITALDAISETSPSLDALIRPWFPWMTLAWMSGILLLGLRLLGGWLYLEYLRRTADSPLSLHWQQQLNQQRLDMGIRRSVQLLESRLLDQPITMGYFKPLILFPLGMLHGLTPAQVEAILLHELAHIQRADYLINYLQSLIEIVLFYHPAVWWISQELRESREHCCDDLALRQGFDRWQYAQAILQLTKTTVSSKTTFAMSLTGNKHSQLSRRIHRLFGRYTPDRFMTRGLLMALLLSGSLLGYAFHQVPAKEIDTFVNEEGVQLLQKEHLFTITPNSSVAEVQHYNQMLAQYGKRLENIERDGQMKIQKLTILSQDNDKVILSIQKFNKVDAYLTQDEEHPFLFETDGIISGESTEEESQTKSLQPAPKAPTVETVETVESAAEKLLFTVTPATSVQKMEKYNAVMLQHGYEFESIVRDEAMQIREIQVARTPSQGHAILVQDFEKLSVYLTDNTEKPLKFQANGNVTLLDDDEVKVRGYSLRSKDVPSTIVIDGVAIRSADPLIVIEGVLLNPQPNKDIMSLLGETLQPEQIESMNVLKGESAVEKWGEDAVNGVIEITIKDKQLAKKVIAHLQQAPASKPLILINGMNLKQLPVSHDLIIEKMNDGMPSFQPGFEREIATVDVLKGTEAIETYGDAARNGVIKIQLKEGAFERLSQHPSQAPITVKGFGMVSGLNVFPNPAGELLTIRFELPKAASVKVYVSDLNGKTVAELLDTQLQAGNQEVKWNAGSQAAGTYIISVKVGQEIQQAKVVIE